MPSPLPNAILWSGLLATLAFVPAFLWGGRRVYRYAPLHRIGVDAGGAKAGLTGWLLVVGLDVVANPVLFAVGVWRSAKVCFSLATSRAVPPPGFDARPATVALSVVLQLGVMLALFTHASALAAVFFARRRSFALHYIAFGVAYSLALTLDALAPLPVFGLRPFPDLSDPMQIDLMGIWIGTLVSIAYVLKSRRVAATFVL